MTTDRQIYIQTVLNLYTQMPSTPVRICSHDRALARQWFARQIPIHIIDAAFLVASSRRLGRPLDALKLAPIRSMAYFVPIVEEFLAQPPPATYVQYLRLKLGLTSRFNTG